MLKHSSFLHVKIILLVCTPVELLTLHSWWAVKIYAYRKIKIVTQQALLSADYWKDYVSCSHLHVNKWLERCVCIPELGCWVFQGHHRQVAGNTCSGRLWMKVSQCWWTNAVKVVTAVFSGEKAAENYNCGNDTQMLNSRAYCCSEACRIQVLFLGVLLLVGHFLCRSASLRDQTLSPLLTDLVDLPQQEKVEGRLWESPPCRKEIWKYECQMWCSSGDHLLS